MPTPVIIGRWRGDRRSTFVAVVGHRIDLPRRPWVSPRVERAAAAVAARGAVVSTPASAPIGRDAGVTTVSIVAGHLALALMDVPAAPPRCERVREVVRGPVEITSHHDHLSHPGHSRVSAGTQRQLGDAIDLLLGCLSLTTVREHNIGGRGGTVGDGK